MPFYLIELRRYRAKAIIQAPSYFKAVQLLGWDIEDCELIGMDEMDEENLLELLRARPYNRPHRGKEEAD